MIDSQALRNVALATAAGIIFFGAILLIEEKREVWVMYVGALAVASVLDWAPVFLRKMKVRGKMRPLVALHAGVTVFSYIVLVITGALTMIYRSSYDRYFLPIWAVAYFLGLVVLLTKK
ncbi:MAG: hypothetical protein HXS54_02960 [Theionarchaea archaeon]|nr:hypothetical protein [Theionarchaea archaeon]